MKNINWHSSRCEMRGARHEKSFILLLFLLLAFCRATAQTGSWRAYMSYYEPQQIVKARQYLFVRASNSLYAYNLNDHSIATYDKIRQLSDTHIDHIAWNPTAQRLIIVYQNANIDLLDLQENVVNISALYLKTMTQSKTVNSIFIHQEYAYLATSFGIVKVNMKREEITESYILNRDIQAVDISGDRIYARTNDGQVLAALTTQNLINPGNWTADATTPDGLFAVSTDDWDQYLSTVQTLQPGGPHYNHFAFMRFKNGQLYTCGGGYNSAEITDLNWPGTVQLLSREGEWTTLQDDVKGNFPGTEADGWSFVDMMSVDVDPSDARHIFCCGRTGLYEYYDGQLRNYYNKDNSMLKSVLTDNDYVIVKSIMYDPSGNLWILQNSTYDNALLRITPAGKWEKLDHSELFYENNRSMAGMQSLYCDSRGLIWFVNNHFNTPAIFCYNPQTDQFVQQIYKLTNQDGTTQSNYYPRDVKEDLDGNIWIATNQGPMMIENANVYTADTYVTQPKIPRNDGTDLADYLMNGADISCIVIDGGNRKWMGTKGQGLYLISADNMEQLQHFTTENSPLLSNNIESLAWDELTGQLYIGTDAGLCCYFTDATVAATEMVESDVYAYPNPVLSSYEGLITVCGLSRDADVKILTTSGQLVCQGRSNGGTFTWNGRDTNGRRVATGIYMVCTATSTGNSGVVCKIAMIK